QIVSRKHPEKISETVVWRRYSDFKKLHRDLAYIHRNLFRRRSEEFPAFAKPTIFGRFEAAVLEERRASAEMLLRFAATVPALYNSQQLKDFLEGGHSYELGESAPLPSLPEPLLPLPGIDSLPSTPPLPA
uniref:PX domain-containing protein n=1 Tax=Petromyzon marinus TaxID=7757 RepID=S4RF22_PETMA